MEKGYEWYKPKKHKKLLYDLFRSNYILLYYRRNVWKYEIKSGYDIDKTIHMMNNGEFMYTIFGNPIIHITLKDYKELYDEFLKTFDNENY